MHPQARELIQRVSDKADNLYQTKQLLCAEAILVSFNEVFDGGLTQRQAVGMSAGMTIGMGGSGCMCGALGGGSLSLGLIAPGCKVGSERKKMRKATNELHDRFKARFGSTCCRVLSRKVKDDSKAHFEQCRGITRETARMTAEILFELRPELALTPAGHRQPCRDNMPCGRLRWLVNWLCG